MCDFKCSVCSRTRDTKDAAELASSVVGRKRRQKMPSPASTAIVISQGNATGLKSSDHKSSVRLTGKRPWVDQSKNFFFIVPNPTMLQIFENMDYYSMKRATMVCRRWRRLILDNKKRMQKKQYTKVVVRSELDTKYPFFIVSFTSDFPASGTLVQYLVVPPEKEDACGEFVRMKGSYPMEHRGHILYDPTFKVSIKNTGYAFVDVLDTVLKDSHVKELKFEGVTFTTKIVEYLGQKLKTCDVILLNLKQVKLDIDWDSLGGLVNQLSILKLELASVSVAKSFGSGAIYLKNVIQMNHQLNGLKVTKPRHNNPKDYHLLFVETFVYDKIYPNHVFVNMFTDLDEILNAVMDWLEGERPMVYLDTLLCLCRCGSMVDFLQMVGAEDVSDCSISESKSADNIDDVATIENCLGQRLSIRIKSEHEGHHLILKESSA